MMKSIFRQQFSWFLNFIYILFAALCCISLANAAPSQGRRIALVIGNGNYQQSLPRLPNPANDAEDIAKALRGFGFEVIERKNQSLEAMNQAIAEFGSKIGGSEAALFYYAGHGIQVKNQNYLIPVNATLESESAVPYQSINLNQVLDEMDSGKSGTNIVMIDACRNNPLSGRFRSGQSRGLASPGNAPKGTVIVYATDPGNVAADGNGRNGLFTAGLLTAFQGNDLSLDGVLTTASAEVERVSLQTQTPYINGPKTLQKNFNFRVTVNPGYAEIEKTFWSSIERSNDAADFEAYLQKYPNGSYISLAENKLKRLNSDQKIRSGNTSNALNAFDGRWNVTIFCEPIADKRRLVKGYQRNFFVDIKESKLAGEDGQVGMPGSLALLGVIQSDGSATISAKGSTGSSEIYRWGCYTRERIWLPTARKIFPNKRPGIASRWSQTMHSNLFKNGMNSIFFCKRTRSIRVAHASIGNRYVHHCMNVNEAVNIYQEFEA